MAYNWAQLAFIEKWRLQAVRGVVVGMFRPEDRTYFDLRIRPGEGNAGQIPGTVDLHLVDAGNLIREKRVVLMDRLAVIVRVVAAPVPAATQPAQDPGRRARRMLEPGSTVSGKVLRLDEDGALVDAGMPVIVQLPEGSGPAPGLGEPLEMTVSETPRGFIVL